MGTSIATPCHRGASQGVSNAPTMPPSDAKVSFFDNLLKDLTAPQKYLAFRTYP